MKNIEDIDQLFKDGLKTSYPYDDQLWQKVENLLPSDSKPTPWFFNLNGLLILTLTFISMILRSDNQEIEKRSFNKLQQENFTSIKQENSPNKESKSFKPESSPESNIVGTKTVLAEREKQAQFKKSPKVAHSVNLNTSSESVTEKNEKLKILPPPIENNRSNKRSKLTTPFSNQTTSLAINEPLLKSEFKLLDNLPLVFSRHLNASPKSSENHLPKRIFPKQVVYELELNRSIGADKSIKGLNTDYLEYRSQNESVVNNFQIGFNSVKHKKNWLYGMGIRYSSYAESMRYDVLEKGTAYDVTYDTNYRVVNGSFNSNGIPVLLIERDIESQTTSREIDTYSKQSLRSEIKRIQAPLFMGLHRSFGSFYTSIRAGLSVNYTYQTVGGYISENRRNINFNETNSINEFVLGSHANYNIGYGLNEYFILGLRLNYEQDLTSFTSSYDSRFKHYGVGVWLMWRPE